MKIYCMSDIHACLASFEEALSKVTDHLGDEDTMLLLLGDYIHGGEDGRKVIDRIMQLQDNYGYEKVIALMGNHEEWVVEGSSTIDSMFGHSYDSFYDEDNNDDCYISWMSSLPRYYTEGNTIFVHAGIDECTGSMWEWETSDDIYTSKYPAETGKIDGLDM